MIVALALAAATPAAPCRIDAVRIDRAARAVAAAGGPGLAVGVAYYGRPVMLRGYGVADRATGRKMTADTILPLASVTKQFTAAAILLLEQDGRLSLDDPLSRFVPDFPNGAAITLDQLLAQTSGLADYADDPGAERRRGRANTPAEMAAWIATLPPHFAPGTRWEYSNANYALLGLVIERASGRSWPDFMARRLFRPAGMVATGFDAPETRPAYQAKGYIRDRKSDAGWRGSRPIHASLPGAAGGLRTTVSDLLKWSSALHGGRILSPAAYAKLVAPATLADGRTTKFGMPIAWQQGLNADYARGMFVTPTRHGLRLWHGGDIDGFRSWLAYYPAVRVGIAIMGNAENVEIGEQAIEAAALAGCVSRSPAP